jgi:hypothetical protein
MNELVRYRTMESLCRQSAVFHPDESWRLLADAEMWHHKAEAIASSAREARRVSAPGDVLPPGAILQNAAFSEIGNRQQLSR